MTALKPASIPEHTALVRVKVLSSENIGLYISLLCGKISALLLIMSTASSRALTPVEFQSSLLKITTIFTLEYTVREVCGNTIIITENIIAVYCVLLYVLTLTTDCTSQNYWSTTTLQPGVHRQDPGDSWRVGESWRETKKHRKTSSQIRNIE